MGSSIIGDRPITTGEQDELGFASMVARLAGILMDGSMQSGGVIGLEGEWGSGKSSLLHLVLEDLRHRGGAAVSVMDFRPWLVGDRDQLVSAFFSDLVSTVAALKLEGGDATDSTKGQLADLVEKVRGFGRHLGPAGKLLEVAALGVPGVGSVAEVISKLAEAAEKGVGERTLSDRKDDLSDALANLDGRIVVAIDDVDRLDPGEALELLRLIRSVADFPNVVYLICYDRQTLARSVEEVARVPSGRAYLEKIVQVELAVPQPESFVLRRWFTRQLEALVQSSTAALGDLDGDALERLKSVIDKTGGRAFRNARSVVRVMDALRAFWPALAGQVDLADLVWLKIISVAYPETHRWIEGYLVTVGAMSTGIVGVDEAERAKVGRALDTALEADGLSWNDVKAEFRLFLPRIGHSSNANGKETRIFAERDQYDVTFVQHSNRLASADHSRLYFAFGTGAGALARADVDAMQDAVCTSPQAVAELLGKLDQVLGDAGFSKARRLLERYRSSGLPAWTAEQLEHFSMGLADAVEDELMADQLEWGEPAVWITAAGVLRKVRESAGQEVFGGIMHRLFRDSGSFGFLVTIFRDAVFSHGLYGGRPNPSAALLDRSTFDAVQPIMLERYERLGLDGVLSQPRAASALYGWSQGGGREAVIRDVATRSTDDGWLLDFLLALRGRVEESNGVRNVLSPSALANFFEDVRAVCFRLVNLKKAGEPRAEDLVASLNREFDFHGGSFEAFLEGTAEPPG